MALPIKQPLDTTKEIDTFGFTLSSIPTYNMPDVERDVVRDVFFKFRTSQQNRDRTFAYFDNRNLVSYIEDSVKRFITNIYERDDIEDWQARVNMPFSRNKVLAVLGKVVDVLPQVQVINRGGEDSKKADIGNAMFEYAEDTDDAEEFFTFFLEEAIVKGTAIGYEGLEIDNRKVRDVVQMDTEDTLSVRENIIKTRKLSSQIVPLEEFYPASVGIRKISDMPYAFWRKVMHYSKFQESYKNYEKSQYVLPYIGNFGNTSVQLPFYMDYITTTIGIGNVEVIKYFDKQNDQYVLIANGIWLNPMKGNVISPIPFNHKQLPFFSIIYDILGSDFFYGKSLVDRIGVLQDVMNVLNNMLLDQSLLTVFSPLLFAIDDDLNDDVLRPGRRIAIDTQGLPISQAVQKLDMGTPGNWHQFILDYTKRILEESSVDSVSQGIAGVGERTTATEIRSAAAGVATLLGLFARFIKFSMKSRARLRMANALQFYTDPAYPILEGVMGLGGMGLAKDAFNVMKVKNTALSGGKRGETVLMMFREKSQLPTNKQLEAETRIDELASGNKITKFAFLPEYIRDFQFDFKLIPSTKSEQSKELVRALEIQFQQTVLSLYPDLVNREELAATLVEQFGRDPNKVLKLQPQPMMNSQRGASSMMPGGGGDNSANTVKGGTGVGGEGIAMRDLMGQMMG